MPDNPPVFPGPMTEGLSLRDYFAAAALTCQACMGLPVVPVRMISRVPHKARALHLSHGRAEGDAERRRQRQLLHGAHAQMAGASRLRRGDP